MIKNFIIVKLNKSLHYLPLEEFLHELPEPAMFGDRALLDGALQWSGHPGKLTENRPT
jgi:hypothetical protein